MAVVLFDMDHTLVAMNTFWSFGLRMRDAGFVSRRALSAVAFEHLLFALRLRDHDEVMRRAHGLITGQVAADVLPHVDDLVARTIAPRLFVEAQERIAMHRARGDRVVIASASPDFVVSRVAALVGVDECIATEHPIVRGRFAEPDLPGAWGAGKVERARRAGLLRERPHVYTDHEADFALIAASGFATLVNPSPRLERRAASLAHEIVRWVAHETG